MLGPGRRLPATASEDEAGISTTSGKAGKAGPLVTKYGAVKAPPPGYSSTPNPEGGGGAAGATTTNPPGGYGSDVNRIQPPPDLATNRAAKEGFSHVGLPPTREAKEEGEPGLGLVGAGGSSGSASAAAAAVAAPPADGDSQPEWSESP